LAEDGDCFSEAAFHAGEAEKLSPQDVKRLSSDSCRLSADANRCLQHSNWSSAASIPSAEDAFRPSAEADWLSRALSRVSADAFRASVASERASAEARNSHRDGCRCLFSLEFVRKMTECQHINAKKNFYSIKKQVAIPLTDK
jgi:hypothetical protein